MDNPAEGFVPRFDPQSPLDLLPYPKPVDGTVLLDEIAAAFRRYCLVDPGVAECFALYSLHTHLIDHVQIAPRLYLNSPTPGCGKTTALTIFSRIVRRPKVVSEISRAVMIRSTDENGNTLLIDESDNSIKEKRDLFAVLNSGQFREFAFVEQMDHGHIRAFCTFASMIFAGIGSLSNTLEDRCISPSFQKATQAEIDALEQLGADELDDLMILGSKARRWANDYGYIAQLYRPIGVPKLKSARAADNWKRLIAVADIAMAMWAATDNGEGQPTDWSTCAREIAQLLSNPLQEVSRPERLIAAIHSVWAADTDRIRTEELLAKLHDTGDHHWARLNDNELSKLLRPFPDGRDGHIHPNQLRFGQGRGAKNNQGYQYWQFENVFARYVRGVDGVGRVGTSSYTPPTLEQIGEVVIDAHDEMMRRIEAKRLRDEAAKPPEPPTPPTPEPEPVIVPNPINGTGGAAAEIIDEQRGAIQDAITDTKASIDKHAEMIEKVDQVLAALGGGSADPEPDPEPPTPPKRGRPKGSKNKVKANGATDPSGLNSAESPTAPEEPHATGRGAEPGSCLCCNADGSATKSWDEGASHPPAARFGFGVVPPLRTPLAEAQAALRESIAAGKTDGIKEVLESWERTKLVKVAPTNSPHQADRYGVFTWGWGNLPEGGKEERWNLTQTGNMLEFADAICKAFEIVQDKHKPKANGTTDPNPINGTNGAAPPTGMGASPEGNGCRLGCVQHCLSFPCQAPSERAPEPVEPAKQPHPSGEPEPVEAEEPSLAEKGRREHVEKEIAGDEAQLAGYEAQRDFEKTGVVLDDETNEPLAAPEPEPEAIRQAQAKAAESVPEPAEAAKPTVREIIARIEEAKAKREAGEPAPVEPPTKKNPRGRPPGKPIHPKMGDFWVYARDADGMMVASHNPAAVRWFVKWFQQSEAQPAGSWDWPEGDGYPTFAAAKNSIG